MDKAMVNLTIDGMACKAEPEATLLQVARDNGIEIPTICHNESLGPEGRCRLCMVEVKKPHTIDPAKCIKCGICYDVCKFDAVAKK